MWLYAPTETFRNGGIVFSFSEQMSDSGSQGNRNPPLYQGIYT